MTPERLSALHAASGLPERAWSVAEYRALLGQTGVFCASDETGFALGRAVAGEAELLMLIVDPDRRRQGAGGRLLAAFEARTRELGATTAYLEVAADNFPARALYARAGYRESGRRPDYYTRPGGVSEDAIVLHRHLAGG